MRSAGLTLDRPAAAARPRRAFTVIELVFVIGVVLLLIGLLLGGFVHARRTAKKAADRAAVTALKNGVTFFNQENGFLPPLIKDMGDQPAFNQGPTETVAGQKRVLVYNTGDRSAGGDLEFLRTDPPLADPDMRFSIYVPSYYLMGVCEVPRSAAGNDPIDGVPGPGLYAPKRDGTFERSGKRFDPFFDVGKHARAVVTTDAAEGRVELRDSNGVAYRYYRWEPGQPTGGQIGQVIQVQDLNVPFLVGDPSQDASLRDAKYAVIGAGPNGIFGNEDQLPASHSQSLTREQMAAKMGYNGDVNSPEGEQRLRELAIADNIVEVGR